MQKKRMLFFLLLLTLILPFFLMSCSSSDGGIEDGTAVTSELTPIKELLAMNPADMTEKQLDELRVQTGGISQEEYEARYGPLDDEETRSAQEHPILDDISAAIWGAWEKVDIPGAMCSNGSQYKVFVMKSTGFWNWLFGYTNDLIVYLEPGGACWDYPSCTGQAGIRGAANPDGIPDNFMNIGDFLDPNIEGGSVNAAISPLILKNHPAGDNVQTSRWNKVFIPYCTGDVHSGNNPGQEYCDGDDCITYHHVGATNIEKVIEYLKQEFPNVDKLMVTGSSAGGVGSLTNYHFFRKELDPNKSYLLNDSGPIFSAVDENDPQYALQQEINEKWNTDYLVGKLADPANGIGASITDDFGKIHELLSDEYPGDPLAITMFARDTNFSGYSYARFHTYPGTGELINESDPVQVDWMLDNLWATDIFNLVDTYNQHGNLHYYIPWYRGVNESHCVAIIEFTGTEIQAEGVDAGNFINDVLNGNPVNSYEENENPDDYNVSGFWMDLVNLLL